MKKIIMLILVIALIASMTIGCGSASTKDATSKKPDTKEKESKANSEIVELEFYALKGEVVTVIDEILAAFNAENPNIKITQTSVSDAGTVLLTRISTNDMPDLLNTYPAESKYKVMFDDGMMTELTNEPFMKNVEQEMLDMAQHNGKLYALPMTLSSYGIYYRTDIFEDLGIKEPTTYKELLDACKKLHDAGIDAFALPNKSVGNCAQRLERLTGILNNDSNSEFKKVANGEMAVEDSVTIRSFGQLCVDIAQYSTEDSLGLDYEPAVADIVNGKAAMMISGTWMLSTMKDNAPDIKIKLIPFPSPLSDELKIPVNIDTSFSLSKKCANQEAGLKFLEFMSRTETAQKYYEVDGNVNMVKGVVFDKDEHMYAKSFMDNGQMFLTQVNFWPTGLREELRPTSQQIFVDNDVDSFVKSFGEVITRVYND